MGNQAAKDNRTTRMRAEDTAFVEDSFKGLSGNSDKLKYDALHTAWSDLVDRELVTYIENCLFGIGNAERKPITIRPYAEHFYVAVKGSLYEQSNYINTRMFGNPSGAEGGITPNSLLKLVTAVVRSYFIVLEHQQTEEYKSWVTRDVIVEREVLDNYSQYLLKDLLVAQPTTLDELEHWLHLNPLWLQQWQSVVVFLYSQSQKSPRVPPVTVPVPRTIPLCELPPHCDQLKSMLDIGKIMFVNEQLPTDRRHKWRMLFNSEIHGESFATFLGKIIDEGPTVLIVEDEDNHVFGGYAPESWNLGPKFVGNDTAVLFKLHPTMQAFLPSGYNEHYQYLNTHQQTMPNGLGMGGQFDYWGLWLDCDYGLGHCSETCTTFKNYKQLSGSKSFRIKRLEAWGVGDEPDEDDDEEDDRHRSVLDKNLEDQVMLELAGKEIHSEGLRDPDLDL